MLKCLEEVLVQFGRLLSGIAKQLLHSIEIMVVAIPVTTGPSTVSLLQERLPLYRTSSNSRHLRKFYSAAKDAVPVPTANLRRLRGNSELVHFRSKCPLK